MYTASKAILWTPARSLLAAILIALLAISGFADSGSAGEVNDRGGHSRGGGSGVGLGVGIGIGVGRTLVPLLTKPDRPPRDAPTRVKRRPRTNTPKAPTVKRRPAKRTRQVVTQPAPRKPADELRRRVQPPFDAVAVADDRDVIDGEIVLAFAGNTTDAIIDAVMQDYGLDRLDDATIALINQRLVRARTPEDFSATEALRLSGDLRVGAVQPNYLFDLAAEDSAQYALGKLGVSQSHSVARGEGIVIGVIDSGVDGEHPALAGAIIEEFDAIGDGDGNDRGGAHGNAVASIIAARDGMIGVAPQSGIVSVRAFARERGRGGRVLGNSFDVLRGVDWSVDKGARILNLSFAGPHDPLLQKATKAAFDRGVIIVAAAGNRGPDAPPAYPAAYASVIGVTATDPDDRLYDRANRGSYVLVAAPGVKVLAAGRRNRFKLVSGTSMSAAYVTGSIALMLQMTPDMSSEVAMRRITTTAKDLGPEGWDPAYGFGLLNLYQALNRQ